MGASGWHHVVPAGDLDTGLPEVPMEQEGRGTHSVLDLVPAMRSYRL